MIKCNKVSISTMKLFIKMALSTVLCGGFLIATAGRTDISPRPCCLRTGDLIFQSAGSSEMSDAISESTAAADSISFVHVAILWNDNGVLRVVEASPDAGVRLLDLDDFLNDAGADGRRPELVVKRLRRDFPAEEAVARALSFLGQPYDWFYLPDNGMMYCSELVYESFLDEEGNHIFTAKPMRFRAPDGSMPQFWTDLYEKLGVDVPEGIPGTNPNDMSEEPDLVETCRF